MAYKKNNVVEEEVQTLLLDLRNVTDEKFLHTNKQPECQILGIDKEKPVVKIGNLTFLGKYEELRRSNVLFRHDVDEYKYDSHNTKQLVLEEVMLIKKDNDDDKDKNKDVVARDNKESQK